MVSGYPAHLHLAHGGEVLGPEPGAEALVHGELPVAAPLLLAHGRHQRRVYCRGEAVRDVGHHELPALHRQLQRAARHTLDQLHHLAAAHYLVPQYSVLAPHLAVLHLRDEGVLHRHQHVTLLHPRPARGAVQAQYLNMPY